MAYLVICPSCRANLQLADEFKDAELSCPRCLARLPYPQEDIQTVLPARRTAPMHLDVKPVDVDVRKDSDLAGTIVLIMGVLLLLAGVCGFSTSGEVSILFLLVGAIICVWSGIALTRRRPVKCGAEHHVRTGDVRAPVGTAKAVAGGCLLGVGVTVALLFMLLLAAAAAIGNAMETCMTCGNPQAKHK
jgi:hypothetical protein